MQVLQVIQQPVIDLFNLEVDGCQATFYIMLKQLPFCMRHYLMNQLC